jgi:hypothetical protein
MTMESIDVPFILSKLNDQYAICSSYDQNDVWNDSLDVARNSHIIAHIIM